MDFSNIMRSFSMSKLQVPSAVKEQKSSGPQTLLPQEVISKKRNGNHLSEDEWRGFLNEYLLGRITDYQMSAMLMAVYFQGMSRQETVAFVEQLKNSGVVLDWGKDRSIVVDKHSTGGVGDKVSLILLPLAVSQGVLVPMIAGRGLGHTGGTVDKVESIGWKTQLNPEEFKQTVRKFGGALIGQTADLAPLERRLYALRDVTATVESVPLIVASILSKKLAEGLGGLVMDVKYGSGAFMPTLTKVHQLARELQEVGEGAGLKMHTVISSMEEPLGLFSGNSLEIHETIETLQGRGHPDTLALVLELTAQMVKLAYPERSLGDIKVSLQRSLDSGEAWEIFVRIAVAQGVDPAKLERPQHLLGAPVVRSLVWPSHYSGGHLASIDVKALGFGLIQLGGGRRLITDPIDPLVGYRHERKIGDPISPGDELMKVYVRRDGDFETLRDSLLRAFKVTEDKVSRPNLFFKPSSS
jgi:pyrimidine-nucleoside phosphorylase